MTIAHGRTAEPKRTPRRHQRTGSIVLANDPIYALRRRPLVERRRRARRRVEPCTAARGARRPLAFRNHVLVVVRKPSRCTTCLEKLGKRHEQIELAWAERFAEV